MNSTDQPAFSKALRKLFAAYGRNTSEDILESFWTSLSKFFLSDVERAFDLLRDNSKSLPTPAHVVEIMNSQRSTNRSQNPTSAPRVPLGHSGTLDWLALGIWCNEGRDRAIQCMEGLCDDPRGLIERLESEGKGPETYTDRIAQQQAERRPSLSKEARELGRSLPDYDRGAG